MSAPKRKQLSDAEVGVIKGLFVHYPGRFTNQDILSKFSIPMRTVNAGRISEIKNGNARYEHIPTASKEVVDQFLEGKIELHKLAGKLFTLTGAFQTVFGVVEYDSAALKVSTHESVRLDYKRCHEDYKIPAYLRILAGMANAGQNTGSVIFGVSDTPLKIVGVPPNLFTPTLKNKWRDLTLEHFEPFFGVRFCIERVGGTIGPKTVAMAQLANVPPLPIICRKSLNIVDKGENKSPKEREVLRESAIYYRYADSTREIRHGELRMLIDRLAKGGS